LIAAMGRLKVGHRTVEEENAKKYLNIKILCVIIFIYWHSNEGNLMQKVALF
jgi:hypothetical protein